MRVEAELLRVAKDLVLAANKQVDEAMPGRLAGIVKTHAIAGVASGFIPVPGASTAAAIASVWGMYFRINNEIGASFSENLIKSVASGVVTNLAAYFSMIALGEGLKFIPGVGTLAGILVMSTASYVLLLASGYVYMQVLTTLLSQESPGTYTDEDFARAMEAVLSDEDRLKEFMAAAKASYKEEKK